MYFLSTILLFDKNTTHKKHYIIKALANVSKIAKGRVSLLLRRGTKFITDHFLILGKE